MDGPVKNLLWVTFLVCTLWKYTEGYKFAHHQSFVEDNNRTLARFRRQTDAQTCKGNVDKFQCATTADCIDVYLKCDGKEDCPDGSDEKESLCKDFPCPGYLFRCDYGACISSDLKCNGVKDCNDNSDETNCEVTNRINSNCRTDQFECSNGQCIEINGKCNGIAECNDKSDETEKLCFNTVCPGYKYKCKYGACVDGDSECDGIQNCIDNSDENEQKCAASTPSPIPPVLGKAKQCTTPPQPIHGQWIFFNGGRRGAANRKIDPYTVITYSCDYGYKLSGSNEATLPVLCLDAGEWSVTVMPTCQKLCPSLYNSPQFTLSCKNDGSQVPCDKATDSTILTFRCAPYYEPLYGLAKRSTCYDGTWDYIPQCIPVCGEKRVSSTPLIVGGREVERGNYPWVVAIYSNMDSSPLYTNICGGSLITSNIVVTAAQCVTKKETGNVNNERFFRVAAGKYYDKYDDNRDKDTSQFAEVAQIETNREYRGELQNFRGDIALLRLKTHFVLSKVIQPVCYNNLPPIEVDSIGLVTGWGYRTTTLQSSDALKELDLSYTDQSKCTTDLDSDIPQRYFTSDKLCAGFTDRNTSVCKDATGGGLAFRNPSYKRRYFIHGIVSLSYTYNQEQHCNIQRSILFTNVDNYISWIQLRVRQWSTIQCMTPSQPTNGQWIYFNGTKGDANIKINTNTVIIYSCDHGFHLSGTNEDILPVDCLGTGEWGVTAVPTCEKLCPSLYNSAVITMSCKNDDSIVPCDKATDNTVLTYKCAPYYKLSDEGANSSTCYNGTWSYTPECVPDLCPSLYDSPLITLSCKNDGSLIPCDKATINTILTYECAPYYEPPLGRINNSTCYNGRWSYTPECIPVCGEKRVSATPLIVNSHEVERGYYPWVVAIYSSKDSSPRYLNICGGSLITTDIVVTAAHCVTKKETGKAYHTKYYRVAAGKYYNRYDDTRDNDTSQFAEVAKIELHREYVGEIRNFRGDIALLKLKTQFALSKVVQPVCYDNLPPLEVNSIGLVTGWGYTTTTGQPSDVLKELDMPYNDEFQCLSDFDTYFSQKYFTPDKLCAGFTDRNTSVCKGDSGGGLVFRNPSYKQRYFIHGIVSLGHSYTYNQEVHCNIQRSALFTKVGYYNDWIQSKVRQWSTD